MHAHRAFERLRTIAKRLGAGAICPQRGHALLCLAGIVLPVAAGCTPAYVDAGHYRVVTATDRLFGLRCQPRTELYFLDPSATSDEPRYLGTCGTPKFVTDHMGMPSDPSCFAVSRDGRAIVYFHRPNWCGAGDRAAAKPGGVYRHTVAGGDALLYTEKQVGQRWTKRPLEPHAIRVGWHSAEASAGGAVCSQSLVIRADGTEAPDGEVTTVHGCPR